ncbi:small ubiquitin-related modifier 1-like [Arabidopsis lyrata subsp. lyrata]|uniref:small ubiquitin-related modifier 1-like n=1 Tax=Arabidopsis lyrata subsp. lyrata TaxID=81972 RepID=UPI000A29B1F7|nr:small ubiquitin-related modifier 1-like [Arabidopsis lyrata subsp. lyrata]|eukprot:XP_020877204.1 small ubiquitin-related modifier 1-like [Arabidopsis lyrata subsp. lyrata]
MALDEFLFSPLSREIPETLDGDFDFSSPPPSLPILPSLPPQILSSLPPLLLRYDGNEVFFRIKRSTQLKKLMNAYCDRQSVDMNSIAFLFDGRRLRAEQTPDELEMEDGDEIDAMLH